MVIENPIGYFISTNRQAKKAIDLLEETITEAVNSNITKVDFGNLCIALHGYRTIENASGAILENLGVLITEDGKYLTEVSESDNCEQKTSNNNAEGKNK